MIEPAVPLRAASLRVAVLAADPRRGLHLSHLVREFGHDVVKDVARASLIPTATIERVVPQLLQSGSIERGWLGVSLHPVALPEALRPEQSQRVGLMVMDVIAGGPAAKAGVLAGDILLAVGGTTATRPGKIARQLGADSIGRTLELTLARAGAVLTSEAIIEARGSA